jgi:hypothetical protein
VLSALFTGLCAACTFMMTSEQVLQVSIGGWMLHALALTTGFCLYAPIQLFGVLAIDAAPDYLSGSSHAFVAAFASRKYHKQTVPFKRHAHHPSNLFLLERFQLGSDQLERSSQDFPLFGSRRRTRFALYSLSSRIFFCSVSLR